MEVRQAYNIWAEQYDTNKNKTRDLEAVALRENLSNFEFASCLEIGCGTGKNTEFLVSISGEVTAVDLSEEMLALARKKITAPNVNFQQADITQPWLFATQQFDLVTFSLVLEHIENLDPIFSEVSKCTQPNAMVYIGELHPFKQYSGSKARFDTEEGRQILTCFNHNITDFIHSAQKSGFDLLKVEEYFDDNDRSSIPRILSILFKKKRH